MAKPADPQKTNQTETRDKSWVPWQDRKGSSLPYRCRNVHVTGSGSAKLHALYEIKLAEIELGGPSETSEPQLARIIERGLNIQLAEYGINPMDLLRNPGAVIKRAIEKIREKSAVRAE